MKATVKPTEKIDVLRDNLEKQVEKVERQDGKLVLEIQNPEKLERTPGIESFELEGEQKDGLGGSPVDEEAYMKIESKEDAVRAFLATVEGYDLRVLETERQWDLRKLKKYNPDIKHLKFEEPKDLLGIEKTVNVPGSDLERVEIELPEDELDAIYTGFLT